MSEEKPDDIDQTLTELFTIILGAAMLEQAKLNPDPRVREVLKKKLLEELDKTKMFKDEMDKLTKEN